jgi:hypothetical protein
MQAIIERLPAKVDRRAFAPRAASSAAAPKRSRRPPKAMAQIENHAQPSARPAITSLSQCTSRSTRLPATITARPAATPASAARVGPPRPRLSRSAAAAKKAADHDEWPLGKDGPSVSAIGFSAGRARSAMPLMVVVRMPFPATTMNRKGTTHLLRVRTVSKTARTTASPETTTGAPRWVMALSPSVENGDACRAPQFATPLSRRTRSVLPRTR